MEKDNGITGVRVELLNGEIGIVKHIPLYVLNLLIENNVVESGYNPGISVMSDDGMVYVRLNEIKRVF